MSSVLYLDPCQSRGAQSENPMAVREETLTKRCQNIQISRLVITPLIGFIGIENLCDVLRRYSVHQRMQRRPYMNSQ